MKYTIFFALVFILTSYHLSGQTYTYTESIEYDPINQQWLASNGDRIIADDGQGNLSYFGTGATSYGLEVMGDIVFGIHGGNVIGYDLNTEMEVSVATIPGASFLNGLTNDGVSNLYATDFSSKKIYKIDVSDLSNPVVSEIVSNTQTTPNGIVHDPTNNRLLFVNWGSNAAVKAVDLATNMVSIVTTTNLMNIDGIDEDNEGYYYLSSWSPARITRYNPDFTMSEIISTPLLSAPADIGYAKEIDMLGIPMSSEVLFISFEQDTVPVSSENVLARELNLKIFPNPVSAKSYIQFDLNESQSVEIEVLDVSGKVIKNLYDGVQPAGRHRILFAGHELAAGIYFCKFKYKNSIFMEKICIGK